LSYSYIPVSNTPVTVNSSKFGTGVPVTGFTGHARARHDRDLVAREHVELLGEALAEHRPAALAVRRCGR
jgi:hypothetical protein